MEKKIFKPRLNGDGWTKTKWFTKEYNSFVKSNVAIPNCTVHVNARYGEMFNENPRDILWGPTDHTIGNAKYWYPKSDISVNTSLERGSKPKLGAIVCFDGNYGHVGVVEKIEGNQVTMSYQEKDGTYFSLATENWTVGQAYSKYGWGAFQGYIYPPVEFVLEEAPKPDTPTISTKFKKGDKVRVKDGAKDYNGTQLSSHVYKTTYTVLEVNKAGDRVVIGLNNQVTAAVNANDLYFASGYATFRKGEKVKVKNGAKDYYGTQLASFVYKTTYTVLEPQSGDRVVIGLGSAVTAAVNAKNLYRA